jgi:hypothetical protein
MINMNEIKQIVDELGIDAFEANTKIAGIAVVSDSGKLIIQTSNWDLTNQTNNILNVMKGEPSINLSGMDFNIVEKTTDGIIATSGMGHVLFTPFQGGVLVAFAMPKADTLKALSFLKSYTMRLSGKL